VRTICPELFSSWCMVLDVLVIMLLNALKNKDQNDLVIGGITGEL